jgi:hypothetical protein
MPGRAYSLDELEATPAQSCQWQEFQALFLQAHRQGEHVAIVGPNGSGKTLLGLELCKLIGSRRAKDGRPSRVAVLQYKPRDDTLKVIGDWPVIKKWPPRYGEEHCVVWPKGGPPSTAARRHRAVFAPLLDQIYQEGSQCVYIPEAAYFERAVPNGLGLSGTMEQFWSTARSNKLTVVSDTQRPRHVTLLMWSEPAWVFIFRPDHRADLKTVAEASGEELGVWATVPQLGGHEFLCVRRQKDGRRGLYVSRVSLVTRNKRNRQSERDGK